MVIFAYCPDHTTGSIIYNILYNMPFLHVLPESCLLILHTTLFPAFHGHPALVGVTDPGYTFIQRGDPTRSLVFFRDDPVLERYLQIASFFFFFFFLGGGGGGGGEGIQKIKNICSTTKNLVTHFGLLFTQGGVY